MIPFCSIRKATIVECFDMNCKPESILYQKKKKKEILPVVILASGV